MNDRCAAGTGRFLEIMAMTLGYNLTEFGTNALKAEYSSVINSMCTVFAESEVISLIAKGEDLKSIARGLHESVAKRIIAMLGNIGYEPGIVFTGGVAKNQCIKQLIELGIKMDIIVPPEPQIIGALGAALLAK